MKIIDVIENRIIRPSEYDSWLRSAQNIQYCTNNGYSRGMLPLRYEDTSYKSYKKWDGPVYTGRIYRRIPKQCMIVDKNEFDLSEIESIDIGRHQAIIYKRDYYKFMGFNLNEQYEMYCLCTYTNSINKDFYSVLRKKLDKNQPILEYLRNFYLLPEDSLLKFLTIKDQALLIKEKVEENRERVLCLKADNHFIEISIEDLKKRIKRSIELKKSLEKDLEKLAPKFDKLEAKRERLMKRSIFNRDYEDKLKKLDPEFDKYSEEIETLSGQINSLEKEISEFNSKLDSYYKLGLSILEEIKRIDKETSEKKFNLELVLNNNDSIVDVIEKENRE